MDKDDPTTRRKQKGNIPLLITGLQLVKDEFLCALKRALKREGYSSPELNLHAIVRIIVLKGRR